MLILTDKDLSAFEKNLSNALVKFSQGKINNNRSKDLAKIAIKNIDLTNSALAHKGINWFAKEIIDSVI